VLLGGSLIWSGLGVLSVPTAIFAVLTLALRPVVYMAVFARVKMPLSARYLIAWFGPRGLSSLLLVLLAVFAGSPGSDTLFAICCLVVLTSLVLHGATPMLLSARDRRASAVTAGALESSIPVPLDGNLGSPSELPTPARPEAPSAGTPSARAVFSASGPATALATNGNGRLDVAPDDPELISIAQVRELQQTGEPLFLADVRTEKTYNQSERMAAGAVRLEPDHPVVHARNLELPQSAWIVAYCT
jgi:hypothetical protein